MYLPKHFAENDIAKLHDLMRAFPLGAIVTHGADGLEANHIPLHLVPDTGPNGTLRGHVARGNPLTQAADSEILIIFQGHQRYISPANYATKAEHGRVVPTWNYCAVHAHGHLRVIDDAAWLLAQLTALTAEHEAGLAKPWAVGDAPADYIEKMLGGVVGIEIVVERLVGKWKVSQNQPAANQASLVEALTGEPMAELIREGALK